MQSGSSTQMAVVSVVPVPKTRRRYSTPVSVSGIISLITNAKVHGLTSHLLAFYLIAMGILSFIFLLGSLRVNGVFVVIFLFVTIGFGLGGGAFIHFARGNAALGTKLATGVGACFFAASVLGFYFFLAIVIAIMELPIPDLPVFDLSTVIKPKSRAVPKQE